VKRIIAYYEQKSPYFTEDNWVNTSSVNDAEDVFEFMRDCHLLDARKRNDYPLCSQWNRRIVFYEEEYEVCNLGYEHKTKTIKVDPPSYYQEGQKMYNEWEKRINRTIPHLREAAKRKKEELKERQTYERLKKKYNNL
jgi:hypothetical protein